MITGDRPHLPQTGVPHRDTNHWDHNALAKGRTAGVEL